MCAIAGTTVAGAPGASIVERLLAEMAPRGPDGAGVARGQYGAIGMCRLRIRGSDAELPFQLFRATMRTAYNGEIYATKGSLQEVPADGPAEATLLLERGPWAVDGMFAAAHAEERSKAIVLDRDPFGIKPLFYARGLDGVTFASELAPLVRETRAAVDRTASTLAEYLLFGRLLDRRLPYEGLCEVLPGERLEVSGVACRRTNGEASPDVGSGKGELASVLREAVLRCTVGDRSLGIAVSGGVDSTILAALVASAGLKDLQTFSLLVSGVRDGVVDLRELPRGAALPQWQHTSIPFGPHDLVERLAPCVRRYGQPFQMSSMLLYDAMADAVSRAGCTVLLTGEGADELFLGYASYAPLLLGAPIGVTDGLRRFYLGRPRARQLRGLLPPQTWCELQDRFERWAGKWRRLSLDQALRQAERELSLEPLLLRNDVTMMGRAVETRTPFLHGHVPVIAAGLAAEQLMVRGATKQALRDAFPALSQGRPKTPFRAALAAWFARDLRPWLLHESPRTADILASCGFVHRAVLELFDLASHGDEEAAALAFSCLTARIWLEECE